MFDKNTTLQEKYPFKTWRATEDANVARILLGHRLEISNLIYESTKF